MSEQKYWNKIFGIETFKIDYGIKNFLYRFFNIKLPKLKSQKEYWSDRGRVYMDEILSSGYLEREIFFQDMLIRKLKDLEFKSLFEAGCGFGWNIKRVKDEFPETHVGGVDFSLPQLVNSKKYMDSYNALVSRGDATQIPFCDDAFDIGITVGVFMNLHPSKIKNALKEMIRVSKKYIIHLEYDELHSTQQLINRRAFKTNIVSHDYKTLYQSLGKKVITFQSHVEFSDSYDKFQENIKSQLMDWESFEGPEKYIFMVVEI
jgi:ubiquinone/menaquinone biosynthesis C-methylase UbiE